jgi:hypothetical protein
MEQDMIYLISRFNLILDFDGGQFYDHRISPTADY